MMNPTIVASIIGACATFGACYLGWWLNRKHREFPPKEQTGPTVVSESIKVVSASPSVAPSSRYQESTAPARSDSGLTHKKIVDAINGVAPMLRDGIHSKFVGLSVCWKGTLDSAWTRGDKGYVTIKGISAGLVNTRQIYTRTLPPSSRYRKSRNSREA
jgi:hypothetical protein